MLEALSGTRLGKHERRLLLTVQSWHSSPRRVEPPAPGRSADESHRRALRRLVALGLLTRHGDIVHTDAGDRYATAVSLTALGGAVREVCEAALKAGRPIRWAEHAEAIAAAWPRCREQEEWREEREAEE